MMNGAHLKHFTVTGVAGGTGSRGRALNRASRQPPAVCGSARQPQAAGEREVRGYPTWRILSALMVTMTRTWSRPPNHG